MSATSTPVVGVAGAPAVAEALREIGFNVITGATFREAAIAIASQYKRSEFYVVVEPMPEPGFAPWVKSTHEKSLGVVLLPTDTSADLSSLAGIPTLPLPATVNQLLPMIGAAPTMASAGATVIGGGTPAPQPQAPAQLPDPFGAPPAGAPLATGDPFAAPPAGAPIAQGDPFAAPPTSAPLLQGDPFAAPPTSAPIAPAFPLPAPAPAPAPAGVDPFEAALAQAAAPAPVFQPAAPAPVFPDPFAQAAAAPDPFAQAAAAPQPVETTASPFGSTPAFDELVSQSAASASGVPNPVAPAAPKAFVDPFDASTITGAEVLEEPVAAPVATPVKPEAPAAADVPAEASVTRKSLAAARDLPTLLNLPTSQEEPSAPIAPSAPALVSAPIAPAAPALVSAAPAPAEPIFDSTLAAPVEPIFASIPAPAVAPEPTPAPVVEQAPAAEPAPVTVAPAPKPEVAPAPAEKAQSATAAAPAAVALAGFFDQLPGSPAPATPVVKRGSKVLFPVAGKGGAGKTTHTLMLAQAAGESGLKVLVIDANRDQGDIAPSLRIDTAQLPTVADAITDPTAGIVTAEQLNTLRPASSQQLAFDVVLAPPRAKAGPRHASADVYASLVEHARSRYDLIVVDTPVMDGRKNDLHLNFIIPELLRDGYALGLALHDYAALRNAFELFEELAESNVPAERTLIAATRWAERHRNEELFLAQFGRFGTFCGFGGDDPAIHDQKSVGNVLITSPAVKDVIDAVLRHVTGEVSR